MKMNAQKDEQKGKMPSSSIVRSRFILSYNPHLMKKRKKNFVNRYTNIKVKLGNENEHTHTNDKSTRKEPQKVRINPYVQLSVNASLSSLM